MTNFHEVANYDRIEFYYVLRYNKLHTESSKLHLKFDKSVSRMIFATFLSNKEHMN